MKQSRNNAWTNDSESGGKSAADGEESVDRGQILVELYYEVHKLSSFETKDEPMSPQGGGGRWCDRPPIFVRDPRGFEKGLRACGGFDFSLKRFLN